MVGKRPDDQDTRLFDDESLAAYMESRYKADPVTDELAMQRDWKALQARILADQARTQPSPKSGSSWRLAVGVLVAAAVALILLWPRQDADPRGTTVKSGAPSVSAVLTASRMSPA